MFARAVKEEEQRRAPETALETEAAGRSSGITGAMDRLQRTVGNAATTQLIQTKLMVGAESDPLEREADRVAEAVVGARTSGTPEEAPEEAPVGAPVAISRAPAATTGGAEPASGGVVGLEGGPAPAEAVDAIARAGSGSSLPEGLQRSMEQTMGADLSGVRVHTGSASDAAASQLQARAFTTGNDVHFAAGEYDPGTPGGQRLIAHEVAHTVQQTGGGAAARSIQRMPSPAAVRARTGRDRKEGRKVFGKTVGGTTSYNAVLDFLKAHSDYITSTVIASKPQESMAQVARIHRLIDDIVVAAQNYLGKGDGDDEVQAVCLDLVAAAPIEKKVVVDIAANGVRNANRIGGVGNPKWYLRLPADPRTYRFTAKDTVAQKVTSTGVGDNAGANKEVKQVANESGDVGYFAADGQDGDYSSEEFYLPKQVIGPYGVTDDDLRLGNRSIAMSRLDNLLNAGVIARTERGIKDDKVGTFQWAAKGKSMDDAIAAGENIDDPNLTRLLSRLQLIDAIAGQIDRHEGNYFIQRDDSGKITGITGIDLDMSWVNDSGGNKFDVDKGARSGKNQEWRSDPYPGFSRYVDKELAERILALDPDDLRAILIDLLPPGDIEAAVSRLLALQALLKQIETQLLEPHEWTDSIRAKIISEKHVGENGFDPKLREKSMFGRAKAGEAVKKGQK